MVDGDGDGESGPLGGFEVWVVVRPGDRHNDAAGFRRGDDGLVALKNVCSKDTSVRHIRVEFEAPDEGECLWECMYSASVGDNFLPVAHHADAPEFAADVQLPLRANYFRNIYHFTQQLCYSPINTESLRYLQRIPICAL